MTCCGAASVGQLTNGRHSPAPAGECEVCGHPGDVHPGSASQHSACAVCIWEADMGHRPQQACCQRRVATPFHTEPHHLR